MNLLEVQHLNKQYKNFSLQDISFSLPAGYIMGYIGQNGAGKTTTLNAITRLVHPTSGAISIDGIRFEEDPIRYREMIGYIGDTSFFPEYMTLKDIRMILRDFYSSFRPEVFDNYVRQWKLPEKQKIKTFSRGMKVKLMFADILSRDTKILILDEATNGLDPVIRREILALLQDYISDGTKSVLFSTHILEDLEQIADYIFFIDQGKKIFCDAKESVIDSYLLVKGGMDDLAVSPSTKFTGVLKNEFGFEALLPVKDNTVLPPGLVAVKPSIDQIVVHMIEEMR